MWLKSAGEEQAYLIFVKRSEMMVKKRLGPEAKKEYTKPLLTRNELLVDITFATAGTAVTMSGGPPGTLVGGPSPKPGGMRLPSLGGTIAGGRGMPGEIGGYDEGGGLDSGGTIAGTAIGGGGTMIPGTGGAPGTVL